MRRLAKGHVTSCDVDTGVGGLECSRKGRLESGYLEELAPWASAGFFPEGGRIFLKILQLIWVHFYNQEKISFPCMSTL